MSKSKKSGGATRPSRLTSKPNPQHSRPDPFATLSNDEALQTQRRAAEGAAGPGSDLPYLDQIQQCFGSHDLSGASSHRDSAAADDISAQAYTLGSDIVFGASPDVRTVGEEAAHYVMQSVGMGPSAVGHATDSFEPDAKRIGDRVAAGLNVEAELTRMTGGRQVGSAHQKSVVQRKEKPLPTKEVPEETMVRIQAAREAIAYAKEVFAQGAGNQYDDLKSSDMQSFYTMEATRENDNFSITPEVEALAGKDNLAFVAAKARLTGGGNCGEHAAVAYDYLRRKYPDLKISLADRKDLDHVFVTIGDPSKDSDGELVVADPWPTKAAPTTWEDHFANNGKREELNTQDTTSGNPKTADTRDYANEMLESGLHLNDRGMEEINKYDSPEETTRRLEDGVSPGNTWIWGQNDAAAKGKKFDYVAKKKPESGS